MAFLGQALHLKDAGYRGFFSMEWEGTGDPYEGSAKLIETSLRNLS